jgi:hypothetical protein
MPRNPLNPDPEVDNDGLGLAQTTERAEWGLPSDEGLAGQQPAHLPEGGFDYSGGMLVAHGEDANAQAPPLHPHLIRARVDAPPTFEVPHEATHRRFEAPVVVPIAQVAAGFLVLAPTNRGLHYAKLLALNLTLDAAGTFKFVQGSNDGTNVADLTGAMAMGGAAAPPLNLPPADLANPWLYSSPDQALGIFTTVGKAAGWAIVAYSPYDS